MFKNKKFLKNILFIFLFLIFILSFSKIKSFFQKTNFYANLPVRFLELVNNSNKKSENIISNTKNIFVSKKDLLSKIESLEAELQNEKNNNVLKKEALYTEKNIIIAKKIFSDFTKIYDTILLDKGEKNGVKEGDMVFVYPDKAIGKIISRDETTSLVSLFSKSNNKVEGVLKIGKNLESSQTGSLATSTETQTEDILSDQNPEENIKYQSEKKVIADLHGYGGGDFIVNLPKNIEVEIGSLVYLAEDESKILGEVVEVKKQETTFLETVLVRGFYNTRENQIYYISN